MSWDSEFYAAVMANSDFSSGVTALALEFKPDGATPFATYQLINANGTQDTTGHGFEGERLIQLTVWADSPTDAMRLCEYGSLGAQTLNVVRMYERSLGRDSDSSVFGYAIDFTIWFDSPR